MNPSGGEPRGLLAPGRPGWLALAVGAPVSWAAAHTWLEWRDGRQPPPDAFPIEALPAAGSPLALLLPTALALAGLLIATGALVVWWKRGGARSVQTVLFWFWVLVWLAGAGGLFLAVANRSALGPDAGAATTARVLGMRARMPSLRQLGGSELILDVANLPGPQKVQITDVRAADLHAGSVLSVQWAPGRFYGRYLVAWARTSAAPDASAGPAAPLPAQTR